MKVALVHQPWNRPHPPVQTGSIAIWIDRIAPLLARHCDVVVFGKTDGGPAEEERRDGVLFRRLPAGRDRQVQAWLRRWPAWSPGRPYYASRWSFRAYARNVARDIARQGCDLIHLHNFSQMVPVMRAACPGSTILLHMHCEWLAQLDSELLRPRLESSDGLLACSNYITNSTRNAFPTAASRCRTVYNGADVAAFATRENRGDGGPHVLFVGRLSPEKGVHVLLRAFAHVLREHPDARLTIVGPAAATPREFLLFPGGDPRVARLLAELPSDYVRYLHSLLPEAIAERVTITGHVPHGEVPALYQSADVVVVPSIWQEPFGMPLVEAMASGVAVVASRVGGIPEIVEHGETGLLVAPADESELSGALNRVLGDADMRARFGVAGRARAADRFSWARVSADLFDVYREIRSGSPIPSGSPPASSSPCSPR